MPQLNHLLSNMPQEVRERLLPDLESVQLPLGDVMYESGAIPRYAYFPTDCIVSLRLIVGAAPASGRPADVKRRSAHGTATDKPRPGAGALISVPGKSE